MLSKPDWCPPDIWSTSVNAAGGEEFAYQAVAEGAARMVCNERERCAQIADNERRNVAMLMSYPPQSDAARVIGVRIRNPEVPHD